MNNEKCYCSEFSCREFDYRGEQYRTKRDKSDGTMKLEKSPICHCEEFKKLIIQTLEKKTNTGGDNTRKT